MSMEGIVLQSFSRSIETNGMQNEAKPLILVKNIWKTPTQMSARGAY